MIPLYIITGWLGSGKTTLLKNIIELYGDTHRMAVIQNEFAPTGVDSKLLNEENEGGDNSKAGDGRNGNKEKFMLVELNNGSVFCVCQLVNFVSTLRKVVEEYKPELIFLETSGLADPINVAEVMQTEEIRGLVRLDHIITILDAKNFQRTFRAVKRFRHQVMVADRLIINKTDLASEEEIKVIRNRVQHWNPFGKIAYSEFCKLDIKDLLAWPGNSPEAALGEGPDLYQDDLLKHVRRFNHIEGGGRPEVNVAVLRSHDGLTEDRCASFIQEIMGHCYRMKGFIKLVGGGAMAVQTVYNEINLRIIREYAGSTEMIIFSKDIGVRELRARFKACARD